MKNLVAMWSPVVPTAANSHDGATWGDAYKIFNAIKRLTGSTEEWQSPSGDGTYYVL